MWTLCLFNLREYWLILIVLIFYIRIVNYLIEFISNQIINWKLKSSRGTYTKLKNFREPILISLALIIPLPYDKEYNYTYREIIKEIHTKYENCVYSPFKRRFLSGQIRYGNLHVTCQRECTSYLLQIAVYTSRGRLPAWSRPYRYS